MSQFLRALCILASFAALTLHVSADNPNPLIHQRADPHIHKHTDGYYYFMGTVPEYDRLVLRRATTVAGLANADEKVIWRKHETGIMGAHIWAPEIHYVDGRWFIYFAAGEAEKIWNIRIYALENTSANPLEGEWIERGQIDTGWESFALDSTVFEHHGKRYLLWAQQRPGIKGNTNLYIAEMDSPTSIKKPAVMPHPRRTVRDSAADPGLERGAPGRGWPPAE
jgi:GH43 family beta-xylosidase